MTKRKLAVVLMLTLGSVLAVDTALIIALAVEHRPFAIPLLSLTAFIPGMVIAALAWQGRLPFRCGAPSQG